MTIAELMKCLQSFPPDAGVYVSVIKNNSIGVQPVHAVMGREDAQGQQNGVTLFSLAAQWKQTVEERG